MFRCSVIIAAILSILDKSVFLQYFFFKLFSGTEEIFSSVLYASLGCLVVMKWTTHNCHIPITAHRVPLRLRRIRRSPSIFLILHLLCPLFLFRPAPVLFRDCLGSSAKQNDDCSPQPVPLSSSVPVLASVPVSLPWPSTSRFDECGLRADDGDDLICIYNIAKSYMDQSVHGITFRSHAVPIRITARYRASAASQRPINISVSAL